MELDILKPRHSLAHILAQAVQRTLDPYVKLGIGPAIDTGFYYDFIFSDAVEFGEGNLKDLSKYMQKIIKENQDFQLYESTYEESEEILAMLGQEFKLDLLQKFKDEWDTQVTYYLNTIPQAAADRILSKEAHGYYEKYKLITSYFQQQIPALAQRFVTFIDLCEGPHVQTSKDIDPDSFTLEKIAGAYRRGDEKNPMMTRIYGIAFSNKQELKDYQTMIEEAKKRDHRLLGQKLELFTFDEEIGPGLPLWLPNWSIIVEELERLAKETETRYEYQRVRTPHISKGKLYEKSGHLPYYADDMFPPMELDNEKYYLKPMNCPHHHKIYAALPKSYRDLPVRLAEYGHCYRYEDSGALFGLMRVRSLCMNDAHIYCTPDQFESEFIKVIEMYQYYFDLFGIQKYKMRLSKHSKDGLGKKYVDNEQLWIQTEEQVRSALLKTDVPFVEAEDEAAFYGPKIDVQIRSAIGREFTLATNQLDFAVPSKFNLTYVDTDGTEKTPLCIHRAPLSTHERFIGFLIEHFAGAFPLRLAPRQVQIVPVAEKFLSYAKQIKQQAQEKGLRVYLDDSDDSFSKKIRTAELMKVPYTLIVGEKEVLDNTVSIRVYKTKEQYILSTDEFIHKAHQEYIQRK
jgi:threonyl-tRNA synthetase